MPDETIESAIESNATGPRRASDDNGSFEQHALADQIEADRYLNSKQATRSGRGLGIKLTKLIPPNSD
jgi:hypothetical protein